MDYKCDKCGKPAPFHLTDIRDGKKVEKHLCEQCAADEGLRIDSTASITKMLEEFVLQAVTNTEKPAPHCSVCGITLEEYRKQELLGCPNDYEAFGQELLELIERVQDQASHHAGKVPSRASQTQKRLAALTRLRNELNTAVTKEDYEQAARLRDQIKELEN